MKRLLLTVMVVFACMTSTYAQKATYKFQATQARLLDVTSDAYVKPLTVELKVKTNTRIRHKLHLTTDEVNALKGDVNNIRSFAVYDASKAQGCDVIVAATFNIKSDDSNGIDVELVGYPADYVNWKTATREDYEWIRMEKTQTTSDAEKTAAIKK